MIDQFLLRMNNLIIKKNEESIVNDIRNDKKNDFPTEADHVSLPNTSEEIKYQRDDEMDMNLKSLLKNERDVETLENLIDETNVT